MEKISEETGTNAPTLSESVKTYGIVCEFPEHRDRKFKYIFHFSDIHICNDRNRPITLDAMTIATDNIRNIMSSRGYNSGETLIVIAGDLFHLKTKYNIKDIPDAKKFLSGLLQLADVVIIPGNHDMNLNNTDDSDDLIADLLDVFPRESTGNKIYYHATTGTYIHGNVNIYHNSLRDRATPMKVDNGNISILLLHETIKGSRVGADTCAGSSNDIFIARSLNSGRFGREIAEEYDYVLLGHVHEYQMLARNMAYCGSLCQHHTDESYVKGFLLWHITAKSEENCEFIRVKTQIGYLKLIAREDSVNVRGITDDIAEYDGPGKLAKCLIEYSECSTEFINKLSENITSRFSCTPTFVLCSRGNKENNADSRAETHNTENISAHEDFMTKKMQERKISEELCADVLCLHRNYWHKFARSRPEQCRWSLVSMKWANMYCYGARHPTDYNYINFSEIGGILGVIAENGAGKSSIIDILLLLLFNKTSKDEKIPEDIVNSASTVAIGYYAEVVLNIAGVKYIITQRLQSKKDKHRECTLIRETPDGLRENITRESLTETYKVIAGLIGNKETFLLSSVCTQFDEYNISNMSATDRRNYMTNLFKFDVFDDIYRDVKKVLSADKKLWEKYLVDISRSSADISDDISRIDAKIGELSTEIADVTANIAELLQKKEECMSNLYPGDEDIRDIRRGLAKIPVVSDGPRESIDELLLMIKPCADFSETSEEKITNNIAKLQTELQKCVISPSRKTADICAEISAIDEESASIVVSHSAKYARDLLQITEKDAIGPCALSALAKIRKKIDVLSAQRDKLEKRIISTDFAELTERVNKCRIIEKEIIANISVIKQEIKLLQKESDDSQDDYTEDYPAMIAKKSAELSAIITGLSATVHQHGIRDIASKNPEELSIILNNIAEKIDKLLQSGSNIRDFSDIIRDIEAELRESAENDTLFFSEDCGYCVSNRAILQKNRNEKQQLLQKYCDCQTSEDEKRRDLSENLQQLREIAGAINDIARLRREIEIIRKKIVDREHFVTVAIKLNNKREQLMNAEKSLSVACENITSANNKINKFSEDNQRLRTLNGEISLLSSDVKIHEDIIADSERYKKLEELSQKRRNLLQERENAEKRDNIIGKIEKFTSELSEIGIYRANCEVKKRILDIKRNAENEKLRADLTERLQRCEKNVALNAEIDAIGSKIRGMDAKKSQYSTELVSLREKSAVLREELMRILAMEKSRDELQKKIAIYSEYMKCIDRESGIQNDLMISANAQMECAVNSILENFVNFRLRFKYEKGVNSKNHVYILHNPRDNSANKSELIQASGYQKFAAGIAIRIAVRELLRLPEPDFMIIDEGFSSSDDNNRNNIREFIQKVSASFQFMLIISHLEEFQNITNYSANIRKIGGFSQVRFGTDDCMMKNIVTEPRVNVHNEVTARTSDVFMPVGNKFECVICNKTISSSSRSAHLKSRGHLRGLAARLPQ